MIGIAVVGYGYWGPNVARNFGVQDGCELRAICDPNPKRLEAARRMHPGCRVTTDLADVLRDDEIHAIAVCTPVRDHYDVAWAALDSGRHVLVEKPLTSSVEKAEALVNLATARGLALQVDHTFVYSPPVRAIRGMIDRGELGNLHYLDSTRINLGLFRSEVGVLWDLAVHDVSIITHLVEKKPIWVSATGAAPYGRYENLAYVTMMYPDELIAHVNVNWLSPVKLRSTVIGGSNRMVVYDDLSPSEKIRIYDKGVSISGDDPVRESSLVDYRLGSMTAPHLEKAEPLERVCADFVRSIESGSPPLVDGLAGLEVVRIVAAAATSLRKGGERISLPSA